MAEETGFKLDQAVATQQALRASLDMPDEIFPIEAFVGMISDEIEAHRKAGRDDEAIVALVHKVTGKTITAGEIEQYYVSPDRRFGR